MQVEITQEYLDTLSKSIANADEAVVFAYVKELHPADIAEILHELNLKESRYIYDLLDEQTATDVLLELEKGRSGKQDQGARSKDQGARASRFVY